MRRKKTATEQYQSLLRPKARLIKKPKEIHPDNGHEKNGQRELEGILPSPRKKIFLKGDLTIYFDEIYETYGTYKASGQAIGISAGHVSNIRRRKSGAGPKTCSRLGLGRRTQYFILGEADPEE